MWVSYESRADVNVRFGVLERDENSPRGAERALIEANGRCRELKPLKVVLFSAPEQPSEIRAEPVGLLLLRVMSRCQEEPLSRRSGGTAWSTGLFQPGIRDKMVGWENIFMAA